MSISPSFVTFQSFSYISLVQRRLTVGVSSTNSLLQAILEIVQQITGNKDPTTVYNQLTTQLAKSVESNNFTATLQAVSKALGANATAMAQVNSIVNSNPVIFIPPTYAPTNSPDDSSDKSNNGLSTNELAGIIIGGTFGGAVILGLLLLLRARLNREKVLVKPVGATSKYPPSDIDTSVPQYTVHHRSEPA